MIAFITRLLPFLGPLLEKITGKASEKAEELRAQAELEEIRAFKAGRISPRFLLRYSLVFIFSFFAALFLGALFFPQLDKPARRREAPGFARPRLGHAALGGIRGS